MAFRETSWLLAVAAASLLAPAPPPRRAPTPPPPLRVLVPAYFYPGGPGREEWDRLIAAADRVSVVAIANPATGPGQQLDPNYRDVIDRAVGAGVKVLGYVNTDYGRLSREAVEADVGRWVQLYPKIQGIFFDLQPSSAEHLDLYLALRKVVRDRIPRGLVVNNPGTVCGEEYVSRGAADMVCLFENREGFERFQSPAWVSRYSPTRFAALAYQVAEPERMRQYLQRSVRNGLGNVYVTDAGGENPWNRLPTYWQAELAAIRELSPRKPGGSR
jgi:hypothetical protein